MMSTYAVPKMTDGHGWEAMLIGEVLVLGCVKGKVMFDYLHTKYDDSGLSLTDVSNLVVKVYHLYRVSNYSNSRVRGYGQLEWPYCFPVRCFQNDL